MGHRLSELLKRSFFNKRFTLRIVIVIYEILVKDKVLKMTNISPFVGLVHDWF